MHKTGACLPKLGQADPRWQALVLDPGLSPEQLLAPARGCTVIPKFVTLMKREHFPYIYVCTIVSYYNM